MRTGKEMRSTDQQDRDQHMRFRRGDTLMFISSRRVPGPSTSVFMQCSKIPPNQKLWDPLKLNLDKIISPLFCFKTVLRGVNRGWIIVFNGKIMGNFQTPPTQISNLSLVETPAPRTFGGILVNIFLSWLVSTCHRSWAPSSRFNLCRKL